MAEPEGLIGRVLEEGDVHLWLAETAALSPLPTHLRALLSDAETARASRFQFPADRVRFEIGRALLRAALSAYLNVQPHELAFGSQPHGKPILASTPATRVRFNISHSGGLVLLGFTLDREIGVDVELHRHVTDPEGLAVSCFSPVERRRIFEDPNRRLERFFQYWTAKESWIKADGRGLSLTLCDYSVTPVSTNAYTVVSLAGPTLYWHVQSLPVKSGYAAAFTVYGTADHIRTSWIDVSSAVSLENRASVDPAWVGGVCSSASRRPPEHQISISAACSRGARGPAWTQE